MLLLERGVAFLAGGVAGQHHARGVRARRRLPAGAAARRRSDRRRPHVRPARRPCCSRRPGGAGVDVPRAATSRSAVYALITGLAASVRRRSASRSATSSCASASSSPGSTPLTVLGLVLWQGKLTDGPVLAAQMHGGRGRRHAGRRAGELPACRVIESMTGTVTDIRLLELSNPNLPLLKRLSVEAPGTFQHSLAMANLAEAAAEAVGANPLLARVCCYYHDIGKLVKPEYFVENQRGANPHDNLSPWMSALVVSNHVKAGLELARQYKLPEPIRDAIVTHHGNKLIRYFYSRAKERAERATAARSRRTSSATRDRGRRPRRWASCCSPTRSRRPAAPLQEPTPGKHPGDDRPDRQEHPGGRPVRRLRADPEGHREDLAPRSSGC